MSISRVDIKELNNQVITRMDESLDSSLVQSKLYPIFQDHEWLEPNEEAEEDILFGVGKAMLLKIGVIFESQNKKWASTTIISTMQNKDEGAIQHDAI